MISQKELGSDYYSNSQVLQSIEDSTNVVRVQTLSLRLSFRIKTKMTTLTWTPSSYQVCDSSFLRVIHIQLSLISQANHKPFAYTAVTHEVGVHKNDETVFEFFYT